MLKMVEGAEIKDFDKLNEEYEIKEKRIVANVNANKILNMFYDFIDMNDDLYFLILEIPTRTNEEEKLKENGEVKAFHKDVYYRDGMSKEFAKEVLSNIGDLFINDGMAHIGIGNHNNNSEIMTAKYNIVSIYFEDNDVNSYEKIFINSGIKKIDKLKTAWDFFSEENTGKSDIIDRDGKNVYDTVELLKDSIGLYFAERRED